MALCAALWKYLELAATQLRREIRQFEHLDERFRLDRRRSSHQLSTSKNDLADRKIPLRWITTFFHVLRDMQLNL